jgi:hypothetical protein
VIEALVFVMFHTSVSWLTYLDNTRKQTWRQYSGKHLAACGLERLAVDVDLPFDLAFESVN